MEDEVRLLNGDSSDDLDSLKKEQNTKPAHKLLIAFLFLPLFGIGQEKTDTVKVVMLVCDTSFIPEITHHYIYYSVDSNRNIGHVKNRIATVYWLFGYEVDNNHWIDLSGQYPKYLDENKNPLSKNIIVWQTKNR